LPEDWTAQSVAGVFESAAAFGLTAEEVSNAMMATPDRLPPELRARYIDEFSGELAKRLLAKHRDSR
jgi:hypothetical protein